MHFARPRTPSDHNAKAVGYGMDANLFGGGYKPLDIEGFIEVVQAQDWKEPAKSNSGSRVRRRV